MTYARTSQDIPPFLTSAPRQTARGPADLRKSIKRWRKSCSNHWEALGNKEFCQKICNIHAEFEHTSRARASFPAKSKTAAIFKSP